MEVKDRFIRLKNYLRSFQDRGVESFKKYALVTGSPVFLGLISGLSVFYFLYYFDAYGIQKGLSYSGHSHLFRSISFGLLTFAYLSIFETWLKPQWSTTRLRNTILWYAILVLVGSQLIFLLFNYFWNWQEWNKRAYLLILKEFPLMMVLPLAFYLILKNQMKPERPIINYLLFQSENGKDQLKIQLTDFLFASSSENYIQITYHSDKGQKQHLIRKPLKVLEQELKTHPDIQRTHRSYLVNKRNIQSIQQAGGKVHLAIGDHRLPVSRRFQPEFLD